MRQSFIILKMKSHHAIHLYRRNCGQQGHVFFVVFTRRADQKLMQRTSPPIVSSTGNLFYPYVVTCAFLLISITFSCLYSFILCASFFSSELRVNSTPAQSGTSASAHRMLRVSVGSASVQVQLTGSGSAVAQPELSASSVPAQCH